MLKWEWVKKQSIFETVDETPFKKSGYFVDFNFQEDARQTVYRLKSEIPFSMQRKYSKNVWTSSYKPGQTGANTIWTVGSVWNFAFQVKETINDWLIAPSTETVSIEEVARVGGTVISHWTQKNSKIDSLKNVQARSHARKARKIASPQNIPLRFLLELRFDIYGEYINEKALGFDDAWLLSASKKTTCEHFQAIGLANISFSKSQNLDFWQRMWGDVTEDYTLPADACDGVDAADTTRIFYAQRPDGNKFVIQNVLVNVSNPEYRQWHVNESVKLITFFRQQEEEDVVSQFASTLSDDILGLVVLKTGWESHSTTKFDGALHATQPWKCPTYLPPLMVDCLTYGDSLPNPNKCPLSACAPYAAGEFEAAIRDWFNLFHSQSPDVLLTTNESPSTLYKYEWVGNDQAIRDFVIGAVLVASKDSWLWCHLYDQTGSCN